MKGCFLLKCFFPLLSLGILVTSCGGSPGGGGSGTPSNDNSDNNYSTIHYASGGSVSKSQWLSMYNDHKLLNVCNNGQSYYDDKCWDNLNIDVDNLNLSVSNSDGTSENIISNNTINPILYNATTSKFLNSTQNEDDLCLRATSEFVPDNSRTSRDNAIGTEGSCWYLTSYDMPWPIRPMYSAITNTSTLSYMEIQTFMRYGDHDISSNYTHNWWLNGTLKINGKIMQLASISMSQIESALGVTLTTRRYDLKIGNYTAVFIFDSTYTNPYYSTGMAPIDSVDQSQKSVMKPILITFTNYVL